MAAPILPVGFLASFPKPSVYAMAMWMQTSQNIGTNPGAKPHGKIKALTRHTDGHVDTEIAVEAADPCIIQSSTNLMDPNMIGVAAPQQGGETHFENTPSAASVSILWSFGAC